MKNYIFSMLKLFPRLYIGNRFYHALFPRKANPILYITNRCNSQCKICNHWKQTPKIDLCVGVIKDLLKAKSIYNNWVVEGGETTLHPQFDEIMELFRKKKLLLFTNGIATDKLVKAVIKYKIPEVHLSIDGWGKKYKETRGVDNFREVLESFYQLKYITNLIINFTISPWNNIHDYLEIKEFCEKMNTKILINIMSNMPYMGIHTQESLIDTAFFYVDKRPYIRLYNQWVVNGIKIPCYAVRFTTVIRPNGDVMLCQYKDTILGNLYERPFDEIWNSDRTKSIQKSCVFCNDCWVSSHRAFDARLAVLMRRINADY